MRDVLETTACLWTFRASTAEYCVTQHPWISGLREQPWVLGNPLLLCCRCSARFWVEIYLSMTSGWISLPIRAQVANYDLQGSYISMRSAIIYFYVGEYICTFVRHAIRSIHLWRFTGIYIAWIMLCDTWHQAFECLSHGYLAYT